MNRLAVTGTVPLPTRLFPFLAVLMIAGCTAILLQLQRLPDPGLLAAAVAIDLTLTASLAWFLMVARPLHLPLASTLVFFVATVLLAELLLPAESQAALGWIALLAVPAELYLFWQAIAGVRRFLSRLASERGSGSTNPDMLAAYRSSMQEVAGRGLAAEILASELAMFHYAFSRVREDDAPQPGSGLFTYHHKCDYFGMVLAISILLLFEMVGVHLLVHHFWGSTPAWILTALSAYGFIWLRADSVASSRRLHELTSEELILRCGLRWNAAVPLRDIDTIEPLSDEPVALPARCLRMVLTGSPNFLLHLRKPVTVTGLYGQKRRTDCICLAIDDPHFLISEIKSHTAGAAGV